MLPLLKWQLYKQYVCPWLSVEGIYMCKMILLGWTDYKGYILLPFDFPCVLWGDRCLRPRVRNAIKNKQTKNTTSLKSQCFLGILVRCKTPSIWKVSQENAIRTFGSLMRLSFPHPQDCGCCYHSCPSLQGCAFPVSAASQAQLCHRISTVSSFLPEPWSLLSLKCRI